MEIVSIVSGASPAGRSGGLPSAPSPSIGAPSFQLWKKRTARPKGLPWPFSNVAPLGAQGDENAQTEDQERRQEALQAHRYRQIEARRRRQAPPADQP